MTSQPLNLYGLPRPPFHRPNLAAAACWLFALDSLIQIAEIIVALSLSSRRHPYIRYQIGDAFFLVHAIVSIAAAFALFFGTLTHQVSPWPRRGILLFILLNVFLDCLVTTTWCRGLFFQTSARSILDIYNHIFLPVVAAKVVAGTCAFACGLIYALQLASAFRSGILRMASLCILGPVLLVWVGLSAFYANAVVNVYEIGIEIPDTFNAGVRIICVTAVIAAGIALLIYFIVAAIRLRRMARS